MRVSTKFLILGLTLLAVLVACGDRKAAPNKAVSGTIGGAASGAGAGAITGFQVGAGTGPGALVGAGFGAVAGGIQGIVDDSSEADVKRLGQEIQAERARASAQELLAEHYERRRNLYPTRDIFPADIFFEGDSAKVRPEARGLIREIAGLNKDRLPWSRLVVAVYSKGVAGESEYAKTLSERRGKEIGDYLVHSGIEARRVTARAVVIDQPLVIDPADKPNRYSQAVEFIPVDR